MRTLRLLGLAALTILVVALCGGSASATVFCKTNTTPCSSQVTTGTKVEMALSGVSAMKAIATDECKSSEWSWKAESAGGSSSTVSGKVEPLKFSSCSCETKVLKNGEVEAHWVSGTMNGTLTSKSAEITSNCSGLDCVYGTGAGTSIGTLTGGEPAKLDVSATLAKISGALCPSTATWTATYEVKTPKPLYVAEWVSGEGPTSTSLTTSLSGEAKSGEEITVNEGSKVKDTATLSGTNASKATGTVKYKVYADKECKELVTSAGEVTVTSGSVPASEEKALEAGRTYYWQAEYSGDSNNLASTSACGKEVLKVKAATTLSTTLVPEEEEEPLEAEVFTVYEGTRVKDEASLSGTNQATATGTVTYEVYSDALCTEVVVGAGEVSVAAGEVPDSEEAELEVGTYYWQAEYSGDALHQASEGACVEAQEVGGAKFRSSSKNPVITVSGGATENQVFDFDKNKVECVSAEYQGSFAGGATTFIMLDPFYSICSGLGGFKNEEIKSEGCEWKLGARRYSVIDKNFKDRTWLVCPSGKLKILAWEEMGNEIKCEVLIGGQEATWIYAENSTFFGQPIVVVIPKIGNLTYEVTKKDPKCKLPAVGAHAGGKLTGKISLVAEALGADLTLK